MLKKSPACTRLFCVPFRKKINRSAIFHLKREEFSPFYTHRNEKPNFIYTLKCVLLKFVYLHLEIGFFARTYVVLNNREHPV